MKVNEEEMKKLSVYVLLLLVISPFFAQKVCADKGPVLLQENVRLSQDSQKAIILHNGTQETLILGTELRSDRDIELLEFIPFPSEPSVELAKGDPFSSVSKLITDKGLVFLTDHDVPVKGGNGNPGTMPVEIRQSRKIGLHDVTTVKINDIEHFYAWLEGFFKGKGMYPDRSVLARVFDNARDYMSRGYIYFVFDYVPVTGETRFVEPLTYMFTTPEIYFPLKTSNLIGGTGNIELIFILPGSVTDKIWQDLPAIFAISRGTSALSSSAKLLRKDLRSLGIAEDFFGNSKIYIQVFHYRGPYKFKNDFTYKISSLVPYAYRYEIPKWRDGKSYTPEFSREELRDLKEFYCPKSGDFEYFFKITDYGLDCWGYIPPEEYAVYTAIFADGTLSGIPHRDVSLQKMTSKKELKTTKIKVDPAMRKDFNEKNAVSYPLEEAFPDDGQAAITIESGKKDDVLTRHGKIYVSRVGFDKARTRALVHVDYIAGPRSGAGYFIFLDSVNGKWKVTHSLVDMVY